MNDLGWACVLLLESLILVMVDPILGNCRLLVTPSAKKSAKDIAETWNFGSSNHHRTSSSNSKQSSSRRSSEQRAALQKQKAAAVSRFFPPKFTAVQHPNFPHRAAST